MHKNDDRKQAHYERGISWLYHWPVFVFQQHSLRASTFLLHSILSETTDVGRTIFSYHSSMFFGFFLDQ